METIVDLSVIRGRRKGNMSWGWEFPVLFAWDCAEVLREWCAQQLQGGNDVSSPAKGAWRTRRIGEILDRKVLLWYVVVGFFGHNDIASDGAI